MLAHKGYVGVVALDEAAGMLCGTVAGITDVITFEGATVPELVAAFRESVEDYLAYCAELGREPAAPLAGVPVTLQLEPGVLAALQARAEADGTSLDTAAAAAIARVAAGML